MTVRVILTVRVSRDRVSAEYGSEHSPADVREYVRRAAESAAASALSHVDADVSLVAAER